jgi:hypothetical protein
VGAHHSPALGAVNQTIQFTFIERCRFCGWSGGSGAPHFDDLSKNDLIQQQSPTLGAVKHKITVQGGPMQMRCTGGAI